MTRAEENNMMHEQLILITGKQPNKMRLVKW